MALPSTDGIRYRAATARDTATIAAIVAAGFATYRDFAPADWQPRKALQEEGEIYDRLIRGDVHARVAFHDSAAVGVTGWLPAFTWTPPRRRIPGRAHLWLLFALPGWWGTGLAHHLLAWSTTGMRDSGFDSAQLWTPRDNSRARAFYGREGWTYAGDDTFNRDLQLYLVRYERTL
jgi:GNAT superfamily N-acetyltransferase